MFTELLVTQDDCFKTVESINKLKKFPIVIYGAGEHALSLAQFLQRHFSLTIDASFVDAEYLSNVHAVSNVMSFAKIKQKFNTFNIIIGFDSNPWLIKEKIVKLNCKQVNSVHIYDHSLWKVFDSLNLTYMRKNQGKFQQVYDFFHDELSKKTFIGYINAKLTLELSYLRGLQSSPQYFPDDISIFSPCSSDIFVDGGAYNGDTLRVLLSKITKCRKYYAFEPDKQNYNQLADFLHKNNIQFVDAFQRGLWSCDDTLYFREDLWYNICYY
ncbi:MAG: hypothetical protein B6247_25610 [Candidatus Parabeggiatoa sp. nov. 2]|nr:MAG: hypothetical protein B6247_25610 [Beggiatoa sp. 4572_84]